MNSSKSLKKTLYIRIILPYVFIIFTFLFIFTYFQDKVNKSDILIQDVHGLADVANQQQFYAEKILLLTDSKKRLDILKEFEYNKNYLDHELVEFKKKFFDLSDADSDLAQVFFDLQEDINYLKVFIEELKENKIIDSDNLLENSENIYLGILKVSGVLLRHKQKINKISFTSNVLILLFFLFLAFYLTAKIVADVSQTFSYITQFSKKFGIHQADHLMLPPPKYTEVIELQSTILAMKERVLLQARIAQQENTSKTIGELAENLAHLINNPLSIIASSARILQKKVKDNTLVQEEADSIVECVARITQTSLSMKKLINSESKDMVSYFNVLNIKYGIELFFLNKFLENNIKLIFEISEDTKIYARENEILQVVFTLVENSIDFLKDFEDETTKWIKISSKTGEKDNTQLLIEDGGVILDENIIYSSMMSQGKSVGLYSVSQTINKNLGSIEFISKPNTLFIINLPSRSIFD